MRKECIAYHLVHPRDMKVCAPLTASRLNRIVKEIMMRIEFTRKYFSGFFDSRHRHWMRMLIEKLGHAGRIALSLDALCIVERLRRLMMVKV
jgi:hypothetical protein